MESGGSSDAYDEQALFVLDNRSGPINGGYSDYRLYLTLESHAHCTRTLFFGHVRGARGACVWVYGYVD